MGKVGRIQVVEDITCYSRVFGFNVQFLFTVVEKEDRDPCIKLCVCVCV